MIGWEEPQFKLFWTNNKKSLGGLNIFLGQKWVGKIIKCEQD